MIDEPKLHTSTHGGSVTAYGHWGPCEIPWPGGGGGGGAIPYGHGGGGYGGAKWPFGINHAGGKTMIDERHTIYEIDNCTSVDELIRFQRGLNADGDMTPKIERLIAARLAYLDVFDAVRR